MTDISSTTFPGWAKVVASALEYRGVEPRDLFEEAGIAFDRLGDPNYRVRADQMAHVWQRAVELTGDPAFGITVGKFIRPGSVHALGISIMFSATLLNAFRRLARYLRLLSDGGKLTIESTGDEYTLVGTDVHPTVALESQDAFATMIVSCCRYLSGNPAFRPLSVAMMRPRPDDIRPYLNYFKAPMEFGAQSMRISFARDQLEAPLPTANPEVAQINDRIVLEYLARMDKGDVASRLREKLIELLPLGEIGEDAIAKAIHMSPRSLQRKLQQQGTSYKEIIESTRKELALQYMRQSHRSIGEIAFLLGFSETSSLSRAFKRWTGLSPSVFRVRQLGERERGTG